LPRSTSFVFSTTLLFFLGILGGCQYMGGSFEAASDLDKEGKTSQAIQAYQSYLTHHPSSILVPEADYRIAKNYEAQSDYTNAIQWYEKILNDVPGGDEELHALLDLAALYQDKLKNPAKAMDYSQRAYKRYMENVEIHDAIQNLINAQISTATAMYSQKNYKGATETLVNVYQTFPSLFIQADTRAKIDSLADRSRRAQAIATDSVDWIVLRNELPFNKSYEGDFPPILDEKVVQSPDGEYLAERKPGSDGKYYLFVAKVPTRGDNAVFHPLRQSFGAEIPVWTSDGRYLVYWQTIGKKKELQKTDVRAKATQTLFYTKSSNLGIHPAYYPEGNKIAYVYAGEVCLVNTDGAGYKQLLKTNEKLDYTAELAWSIDGTMIRCSLTDKHKKTTDELLNLDVSAPTNP
jgi:hypothetical protein